MTKKDKIKVLTIPFNPEHSYQKLWVHHLEEKGIEFCFPSYKRPYFFIFLRSILSHKRIDILDVHWINPFLHNPRGKLRSFLKGLLFITELLTLKVIKMTGKKIVYTHHNYLSHEANCKKFEQFLRKRFVGLCDRVFVHSRHGKRQVEDFIGIKDSHKVVVVPNGNYVNYYPNRCEKQEARSRLNLDSSKFIFLFFGNIRPYKGVMDLICAFKDIPSEKNPYLLIVGKPFNQSYESDLKKMVSKVKNISCHFDYVSDERVQEYMNAADVVALPFRSICNSASLILAMGFKKTIVAPAFEEVIEYLPRENNYLYKPNDMSHLKNALSQSMEGDNNLSGELNFQKISSYSWDKVAAQVHSIFIEMKK